MRIKNNMWPKLLKPSAACCQIRAVLSGVLDQSVLYKRRVQSAPGATPCQLIAKYAGADGNVQEVVEGRALIAFRARDVRAL